MATADENAPLARNVLGKSSIFTPEVIDDIQTQLDLAQTAHGVDSPSWEYGVYSTSDHVISELSRYHTGDVMDTIRRRRNKLIEARHNLGV